MADILVLDLEADFWGVREIIHPIVLRDKWETVLVDCGYTGFLPKLEEALNKKGLTGEDITSLLLTHQDHDHMGAAGAFKRKYPKVRILSGAVEAPSIEGTQRPLRLLQAEALQEKLPEEQKAFGLAFMEVLKKVEPVKMDQVVVDGSLLPWCGGCRVMATPGHTPGHISLYLEEHKTLIAGDGAVLEEGVPVVANPQFACDLAQARESLRAIMEMPFHTLICYHGGIWER